MVPRSVTRVAVAGLQHESNSFGPPPTRLSDFEQDPLSGGVLEGRAVEAVYGQNWCIAGFAAESRALGHDVVPLLFAHAEPGGPVEAAAFEALVDRLLRRLGQCPPLDAVFIELHGAMVTSGDDCPEATLLERLRPKMRSSRLVASVDLHANVSPRLLAAADVLTAYRTYPHVDQRETGARAARILARVATERPLCRAHRYLPFMMPVNRQVTLDGPMRELLVAARALEEEDPALLNVELTCGFQPVDIEHPLPAVFACAFDQGSADAAVERLAALALALEPRFDLDYRSPAEAARSAACFRGPGTLMLADAQDNPGGGGSADTMFLARALLEEGVESLLGVIHDPLAAAAAHRAGERHRFRLALGGRTMRGDWPLEGEFEVLALRDGAARLSGPMLGGMAVQLGPSALLRTGPLEIVVASARTQCADRGFFTHFGIDPAARRVVAVKSAVHFRADFDPISAGIVDVLAPGFEVMDYSTLPYARLQAGVRYHGCGPAHVPRPGVNRR